MKLKSNIETSRCILQLESRDEMLRIFNHLRNMFPENMKINHTCNYLSLIKEEQHFISFFVRGNYMDLYAGHVSFDNKYDQILSKKEFIKKAELRIYKLILAR